MVTTSGEFIVKIMRSQKYANIEKTDVVKNTPMSSMGFTSSTAMIDAAVITSKLKDADPTIVKGPSSDAGSPRVLMVSITLSKISGADEPRAMSVRFAMVAFHT